MLRLTLIKPTSYDFLFDMENRAAYTCGLCTRLHKQDDGRKEIVI
jgi:hypothetical protein